MLDRKGAALAMLCGLRADDASSCCENVLKLPKTQAFAKRLKFVVRFVLGQLLARTICAIGPLSEIEVVFAAFCATENWTAPLPSCVPAAAFVDE
jgi:hypothetical protein